jgi:hypothetical protein
LGKNPQGFLALGAKRFQPLSAFNKRFSLVPICSRYLFISNKKIQFQLLSGKLLPARTEDTFQAVDRGLVDKTAPDEFCFPL